MQYNLYSDGVALYRDGVRNGRYVIDKSLTGNSFSGVENTDWTNIFTSF